MPRLVESEATLKAIKQKALRNAKVLNTYGTRSSFSLGHRIISFTERCQIDRHLSLDSKH